MAKKQTEKLEGKFQPGCEIGRMYTFLSDGKPHSKDEVIKGIKPKTGRIVNKTKRIQEWGASSKLYTLTVAEDGALQMTLYENGTAKKTAKKSAAKKSEKTE